MDVFIYIFFDYIELNNIMFSTRVCIYRIDEFISSLSTIFFKLIKPLISMSTALGKVSVRF